MKYKYLNSVSSTLLAIKPKNPINARTTYACNFCRLFCLNIEAKQT